MKIGIISDSHKRHKRQKKVLDELTKMGAEFFIHAGDIVVEENLAMLKEHENRYIAIFGNNDRKLYDVASKYTIFQEPYYFKLAQTTFKLMHHPYFMSPDSDIVISGHTHDQSVSMKNGVLYLNPGEVCARNKPVSEALLLEILDEQFNVTTLQRAIKSDHWDTHEQTFTRLSREQSA